MPSYAVSRKVLLGIGIMEGKGMSSPGAVGIRSSEEQRRYLAEQIGEMLGPFNRWVAGLTLKHPPSDSEAIKHYVEHGGAEDFARRHGFI